MADYREYSDKNIPLLKFIGQAINLILVLSSLNVYILVKKL